MSDTDWRIAFQQRAREEQRMAEMWRDIKLVAGIWGLVGLGVLIGWLLFS